MAQLQNFVRFVTLNIVSNVVSTFPIWEKKHAEVIMPVINKVCEEYWTNGWTQLLFTHNDMQDTYKHYIS